MAFSTYNNNANDDKPVINVYSSVNFTNPDSPLQQSRFSISYFNRLMQISISLRMPDSTQAYPVFDRNSAVKIYLSSSIAKVLYEAMKDMFNNPSTDKHNICVETKNGLFKVSDGKEYKSSTPVFSIMYVSASGATPTEVLYQTKNNYEVAYNYSDGKYDTFKYPNLEVETFMMTLDEYYKSSSYAIASSVHESSMYRDRYLNDTIKSIAGKVGATVGMAAQYKAPPNSGSFNNHSFLSSTGNSNGINGLPVNEYNASNVVPKAYQQSSFDDILNGMNVSNDED